MSNIPSVNHLLLRVVDPNEIHPVTNMPAQTAFRPVDVASTAFGPYPKDKGKLSTEHDQRPGGAAHFRATCGLDVGGIWGVEPAEATDLHLLPIYDGGQDGLSECHVSIEFGAFVNPSTFKLTSAGKRTARALRDRAVDRGQLA